MAAKKAKPGALPENRRVKPPENRRSARAAARIPLSARLVLFRERLRVRLARLRRVGSIVLALFVTGVAVCGLWAVGKLTLRHLLTSPAFSTSLIEVHGSNRLSHAEVAATAGLALGQNVFAVDVAEASRRLKSEPWIESATVERRLPGTYTIEIRERKPIAMLALDRLYLVGEDGTAFKPLSAGDPADLPVITGLDPDEVRRDKKGSASLLVGAVALLHEYQDAGLFRAEPISEIHAEPDGSLSLHVGSDVTYVRLGKAPYRTKLRRLREILAELRAKKTRASYVYLDNERRPDRVTVRLR